MLKLKLHYFDHLMGSTDSLKKTLMHGKIEAKRRSGQQRMRRLDGITDSMDVRLGPDRRLSAKELMLLNCGAGEDSGEFLGLQGDQTNQS